MLFNRVVSLRLGFLLWRRADLVPSLLAWTVFQWFLRSLVHLRGMELNVLESEQLKQASPGFLLAQYYCLLRIRLIFLIVSITEQCINGWLVPMKSWTVSLNLLYCEGRKGSWQCYFKVSMKRIYVVSKILIILFSAKFLVPRVVHLAQSGHLTPVCYNREFHPNK